MIRCSRCHMPDTRPGSIFDKGVCQACRNFDTRKKINWNDRKQEFISLCETIKDNDGKYDCIVGVSGGKDSYRIVHELRKQQMTPLLVTVGDIFTKTKAGTHNLKNLCKVFNCEHVFYNIGPLDFKEITRYDFENSCEPLKYIERVIYDFPIELARSLGIKHVFFGEDSSYIYGSSCYERNCIRRNGVSLVFMSYYFPWSSMDNLGVAKKYGFKSLGDEWKREGFFEDFEQIDSMAYIIHLWLKYPKFGFQRTCDIVSRRIREGLIGYVDGKRFIDENDHKIDKKALMDFCNCLGYTVDEFWEIVDGFNTYLEKGERS